MRKSAKTKLKERELAARLVGISTPVGGIDWEPPAEERERAKQVLTYLAEQRVLWDPYDITIGSFVTESILDMRKRLSHDLKDVPGDSVVGEDLLAMQAACRMFWDENPPYKSIVPLGQTRVKKVLYDLGELLPSVFVALCLRVRNSCGSVAEESPFEGGREGEFGGRFRKAYSPWRARAAASRARAASHSLSNRPMDRRWP
jgi:hypothetical protein